MEFDFTSTMNRHGKDAIAVDGVGKLKIAPDCPEAGYDVIPMWIADMNFPTTPGITEAIQARANHPAFGYFEPTDDYFNAIIHWHKVRNKVTDLTREHIGYENGVLGGLVSALNIFCSKGDSVLVHSPTYIGFTTTLENNGYHIIHSSLMKDTNDVWRMDFEDMDQKIKENKIHAAVFCSPHNPTGRVWERWELEKAMEIFRQNDVFVISDEIWSDIILGGRQHIPTHSVSEDARNRTVSLYAPSKTFNLAGLIGSYHIVYNSWIRDRLEKESSLCHYNEMNVLSMHALIAAYQDTGAAWTDAMCQAVEKNISYVIEYLQTNFKGVEVSKPEGTYMLFVDFSQWCKEHGKSIDEVQHAVWRVGVSVQDGRLFRGSCHIRMNLALPLQRVQEAMERMRQALGE